MNYIDYDVAMLRQFFNERELSAGKINYILNKNPFDLDYVIWEKQTINNNFTFSKHVKCLIGEDESICEITNHKDNRITSVMSNPSEYRICTESGKIYLNFDSVLLFKGIANGEDLILRNIDFRRADIVMGVCTKNPHYYKRCKEFYESVTDGYHMFKIVKEDDKQKIYIASNRRPYKKNLYNSSF
nr:hypothetical protein [Bacilli bacterium]